MKTTRLQRIEAEMHASLSKLLQSEAQDPRLKLLTITGVKVSADLSYATIYWVCHDEMQRDVLDHALKKANHFLRYHIAQLVKLRKMPELRFYYDRSLNEAERIDRLLEKVSETLGEEDKNS